MGEKMGTDGQIGVKTPEEAKAIHDFYKVLNQICAVGVVMEIMLLPPSLDPNASVLKNMWLWMDRMIGFLELKPGMTAIDVGSGRGKIAQKIVQDTGAKVIQINIDETQVAFSKQLAEKSNQTHLMEWHIQDYNKPFPFVPDESLDAQFCAQSCGFMHDRKRFLKEVYRMLKPGGRIYNLEWLAKDKSYFNSSQPTNFDPNNKEHHELCRRTGVMVGGAFPALLSTWEEAFKEAGLELLASREPAPESSIILLNRTNAVYEPLTNVLIWAADWGIVSQRFKELFIRLRTYWDASVKAHELDLCSMTYEFVARKPLK